MRKTVALLILLLPTTSIAAERHGRFSVGNMTCALCPLTVKKAMSSVPGVLSVAVNIASKEATVSYDDAETVPEVIANASTNAGYPAALIALTP